MPAVTQEAAAALAPPNLLAPFQQAAQRLEARADVARQILAEIREEQANDPHTITMAREGFNDDDLYVYDGHSLKFVRRIGCKSPEYRFPQVKAGEVCEHGLRAKYRGLWLYRNLKA